MKTYDALRKLSRHLSDAQDILGRIHNAETRVKHPDVYKFAYRVWGEIEKARREGDRLMHRSELRAAIRTFRVQTYRMAPQTKKRKR